MEKKILIQELIDIIKKNFPIQQSINEHTALINDKVLDSLEFMNYLTEIEIKFKIKVSDDDIFSKQLGIIGNMADFIIKQTQNS